MDGHRRRLLALLGTAGVSNLAGCSFFIGDGESPVETPPQATDEETETETTPEPTPRFENTKLTPQDGDSTDLFGGEIGVSSDGTNVVIGAPLDEDPNGEFAGSAYLFRWEGGEWSEGRKLTPQDGDSD
ncbi:MAG: FG-GAP repeat protein, partial [Halobacteriales archaeon]